MLNLLGSLLCWLGFHKAGPEHPCVFEDRTRRRYLWAVRVLCVRCGKKLKIWKTGEETKMRPSPRESTTPRR